MQLLEIKDYFSDSLVAGMEGVGLRMPSMFNSEILQALIRRRYGYYSVNLVGYDNVDYENVYNAVVDNAYVHKEYLNAVLDSLEVEFDPLILDKMKVEHKNEGKTTTKEDRRSDGQDNKQGLVTDKLDSTVTDKPATSYTTTDRQTSYDSTSLKITGDSVITGSGQDVNVTDSTTTTNNTETNTTFTTDDNTIVFTDDTSYVEIREGYNNIDYVKSIEALYKSKTLVWCHELAERVILEALGCVSFEF